METSSAQTVIGQSIIFFKIGFALFAAVYFIFSLIIIRQVNLMTTTVKTQSAGILKILSYLFCLLALGILVYFVAFF